MLAAHSDEQAFSAGASPSHGADVPCHGAKAATPVSAATPSMGLQQPEMKRVGKPPHGSSSALLAERQHHTCAQPTGSEDEADLHVVRRTAVIVRHDSGRFTPDVLPETAGELISQPGRARCFLFRSRAQKGNELLLKKGEVKKGDGPSWAGRLLSHAAGSAALTHMELYK